MSQQNNEKATGKERVKQFIGNAATGLQSAVDRLDEEIQKAKGWINDEKDKVVAVLPYSVGTKFKHKETGAVVQLSRYIIESDYIGVVIRFVTLDESAPIDIDEFLAVYEKI